MVFLFIRSCDGHRPVGLVTDVGGALAHGSIVAREYGIPAVMGTGVATERIKSGMMLAVDGDAGTVTLVDEVESFEKEATPSLTKQTNEEKESPKRGLALFALILLVLIWWRKR